MSAERKVKSEISHFPDRAAEIRLRTEAMMSLVGKVYFYTTDETDEFQVLVDGQPQGIFKTWANPVIPFLEGNKLEQLANETLTITNGSESSFSDSTRGVLSEWSSKMELNPLKFEQSLEYWRSYTETYDRRLHTIFEEMPLPEDEAECAAELLLRMQVAFAYLSPFYHIEAMIAENANTPYNPIKKTHDQEIDHHSSGGLDIVAMVLPAALKDVVVAQPLNWNGLSWNKIKSFEQEDKHLESIGLATQIAHHAGVAPEDILFAANALEWIPVSVGGKKADFTQEEARAILKDSLLPATPVDTVDVARNMNALIRFLNWMPLNKSENNFQGRGWRYASVCDTASKLLDLSSEGQLLDEPFQAQFKNTVEPQLQNLDATSAKGRYLLSLLQNGQFKSSVEQALNSRKDSFLNEVSERLADMEVQEEVVSLNTRLTRIAVGGKAMGLRESQHIFGEENVLPGIVVTSETIERWMNKDSAVSLLLRQLSNETDIDRKLALGEQISHHIRTADIEGTFLERIKVPPNWSSLAVRSSSYDEDTVATGAAAGIYESVIDTPPNAITDAVKEVIASAFTPKAISYRALSQLKDPPNFAVVITPFIQGPGGAIFTDGKGGWQSVVGETPQSIVNADGKAFDNYNFTAEGKIKCDISKGYVGTDKIKQLGAMASHAESLLGKKVDIEFVVDLAGKLTILQMRSFTPQEVTNSSKHEGKVAQTIFVSDLVSLRRIEIGDKPTRLQIAEGINLDQFQGELFRFIMTNRESVTAINLPHAIPETSHFANICGSLGIIIESRENDK